MTIPARMWFADTASPYERRLLLDLQDWTHFEDLGDAAVPSATVELSSNQVCYVEILLKEATGWDHVTPVVDPSGCIRT